MRRRKKNNRKKSQSKVVEITVYDGVTKFDHSVLPKNIKRTSFSSCNVCFVEKKKEEEK